MKKLVIFLTLLLAFALIAQEGFQTRRIRTNDNSINWALPDTSEVFDLYQRGKLKFFFNDTLGVDNDSCKYQFVLYTSSSSMTFDSTFSIYDTVFTTTGAWDADSAVAYWGGMSRTVDVSLILERWGVLVGKSITDGSVVDDAMIGYVIYNGWSNQRGAEGRR